LLFETVARPYSRPAEVYALEMQLYTGHGSNGNDCSELRVCRDYNNGINYA
jgi:hypothetical protein